MKKLLCLCVVISISLNITYSQQKSNLSLNNNLSVSPVSGDYYEYYLKSKTGRNKDLNLGYIPSTVEPIFQKNDGLKKTVTFDAVYDLRTENLVTSVKNQNPYGTCWSFATYGSVESNWLKNGLGTYDLSENHLVVNHGFELGYNDGGNAKMSVAYLTRLNGPVTESDDPYDPANGSTGSTNYVKYVTDARFINNDASTVKQTILDHGAIQTNMYWDATYYSSSDYTYYYAGSETTTNHGVLLVGWDDNKVVTGNGTNTPNNPGSWIIKNSWGTSWGESGYFYISYEDPNINTSLTYYPEQQTINDKIVMMYYDKLGWTNSLGYGTTSAYALVKYTVSTAHELMKVGTFVTGDNTTVKIDIFSDFELTNQLADLTQTVCASPGYYTFDVNSGVSLTKGSDVYIRIYYNTPGASYPVPVEGTISDYSNPTIESNKCWLSSNGSSWSQIGSGTGLLYDLCIKTFGSTDGSLPVNLADVSSGVSNGAVTLSWTTGSELNNRGFIIEREYNDNWIEIASYQNTRGLAGKGNCSEETEYTFVDEMINSGVEYKYRISDVATDGTVTVHDDFIQMVKVPVTENIICEDFKVANLYPNPFNPSTVISYQLKESSLIKIRVYDLVGNFVDEILNKKQSIGTHSIMWQPENIAGGIYFIQISNNNHTVIKKCLYIK